METMEIIENTKQLARNNLIHRFKKMGKELLPEWNPEDLVKYCENKDGTEHETLFESHESWYLIAKVFHIKLFLELGMSEDHEEYHRILAIDMHQRQNCIICPDSIVGKTEGVGINFKNFMQHYVSVKHLENLINHARMKSTNSDDLKWNEISEEKMTILMDFKEKLLKSIKVDPEWAVNKWAVNTKENDPIHFYNTVVVPKNIEEKEFIEESVMISREGGFLDGRQIKAVDKVCKIGVYAKGGGGGVKQEKFTLSNKLPKDELDVDEKERMYLKQKYPAERTKARLERETVKKQYTVDIEPSSPQTAPNMDIYEHNNDQQELAKVFIAQKNSSPSSSNVSNEFIDITIPSQYTSPVASSSNVSNEIIETTIHSQYTSPVASSSLTSKKFKMDSKWTETAPIPEYARWYDQGREKRMEVKPKVDKKNDQKVDQELKEMIQIPPHLSPIANSPAQDNDILSKIFKQMDDQKY